MVGLAGISVCAFSACQAAPTRFDSSVSREWTIVPPFHAGPEADQPGAQRISQRSDGVVEDAPGDGVPAGRAVGDRVDVHGRGACRA
jgi:hypothetical protein